MHFQPAIHIVTVGMTAAAVVLVMLLVAAGFSFLRSKAGWGPWLCYQVARLDATFFFRWRSENACPYPETGPAIIVANHTSPVDPVILWIRHFAGFRRPHLRVIGFMTAKEYCELPGIVGWACRTMECIPVERKGHDIGPVRSGLERLRAGKLTGLFPEGRLNVDLPNTRLLPGNTGVAWLALKSQAPVIPVFIRHAPRSTSMVRCFLTRTRTTVIYGRPLDLTRWYGGRPTRQTLAEVTNLIMSEIARLGGIDFTPVTAESAGGLKSESGSS